MATQGEVESLKKRIEELEGAILEIQFQNNLLTYRNNSLEKDASRFQHICRSVFNDGTYWYLPKILRYRRTFIESIDEAIKNIDT